MIRRLTIVTLLLLLAACGGQVREDSRDVSGIPDAVPKHEPITRAGNKNPYTVLGKTYYLLPTYKNYRQTGKASWYGPGFHGKSTSNGEPYDMYGMTAAHKTLPIPCYVQVTNLENGRKAIVRVNDRGPFYDDRIIDLSYVAAKKLGVHAKGTAKVEVVAIDPSNWEPGVPYRNLASEAPAPSEPRVASVQPTVSSGSNGAFLQVGAFSSHQAADNYRRQSLNALDFPIEVRQVNSGGKALYKVLVGPFAEQALLHSAQNILKQRSNLSSFVVYH